VRLFHMISYDFIVGLTMFQLVAIETNLIHSIHIYTVSILERVATTNYKLEGWLLSFRVLFWFTKGLKGSFIYTSCLGVYQGTYHYLSAKIMCSTWLLTPIWFDDVDRLLISYFCLLGFEQSPTYKNPKQGYQFVSLSSDLSFTQMVKY